MGGAIALTVRMSDGKEHRMERWTNILPRLIYTPDFWKGGSEIWTGTIKHWYEESKKKDKGETLISSWGLYENPYLAPSEYGVLVVDYKTMTIVSCQGYLAIDTVMPGTVKMFVGDDVWKELEETGIVGERVYKASSPDTSSYKIEQDTWKLHIVRERDLAKAKELIESLGFKLSKKEEELWKEKIEEWEE